MKFRYLLPSLILFFLPVLIIAQDFGIGQWRDQLPYLECISVNEAGNKIYAATPYSLFYLDKDDNSVYRINKINGLSDIGISSTNYSPEYNTLVVAYSNANLDLIKGNRIINIPDIKRAYILGNKTINTIYFIGKLAYLGCGFGIVVLDIDKEEIADTYYIGQNGSQVNVLSITRGDNDTLYAGSDKGLYTAYSKSTNLANFQSWKKDSRIDLNGYYYKAVTFAGEVLVSMHRGTEKTDSVYRLASGTWTPWALPDNNPVSSLRVTHDKLLVVKNYFLSIYDPSYTRISMTWDYGFAAPFPLDAIVDKDNINWVGDNFSGLVRNDLSTQAISRIDISGPLTAKVFSMSAFGNDIYVVPGGRDNSYTPLYNPGQVYHFNGTDWNSFAQQGGVHDYVTISADPADPARTYAGSWGKGLVEFYNGQPVRRYTESNSTLRHHTSSDTSDIRVGGTAFDENNNLWVVTSHNNNCLSRKSGEVWTGYNIPIVNESDLGQLMIDKASQKWIIMRYGTMNPYSLLVFSEADGGHSRKLNTNAGSGGIPGNTVFSMAVDKEGLVWVGTEKGIGVFYSPEDILTDRPSDAQRILVQVGSHTQYLMENELVTAIAVDGANRKWIGTDRGGVFLFSADGTKELLHFTEDNSPLFSNRISSISISPESGEVFIGTDKGIIAYKGTATEGGDTNGHVYAYPNPVREDFEGYIAIKGLVSNAEVRITDAAGTLIYSTRAEGGQAIWDGKNFDGRKARTGVYLVYANNSDGTQKVVTKILIVR